MTRHRIWISNVGDMTPARDPEKVCLVIREVASGRRNLGENNWGGITSGIIWYHHVGSWHQKRSPGRAARALAALSSPRAPESPGISGKSLGDLCQISGRSCGGLAVLGSPGAPGTSRKQLLQSLTKTQMLHWNDSTDKPN